MNYYEHHLGDYVRDTAHLSMLEDGAYRRLIDAYYIREEPFPDDLRNLYKLARATSKAERQAVDYVLAEFFVHEVGSGWAHHRCQREIARFQEKQRKAKASADARWANRPAQSDGNANASVDDMRTHSEGNAPRARPQSPDTSHQTPEESARASGPPQKPEPAANGHAPEPTPAGLACKAMKRSGLMAVNPGDPRLLALLQQGATLDEFSGIAAEAVAKGKGFPWVLKVLESRRAEAAAIALAPPVPATPTSQAADRTQDYLREQYRPFTAEEKAKADEARQRAMAAVGITKGST